MARPPRNQLAIKDLAKHMKPLKRQKRATAKDLELHAFSTFGVRVNEESMRKALAGDIDPTACAVELLMALCSFYEVPPAELGHFAEQRLNATLTFARRYASDEGPGSGGGQEVHQSGWTDDGGADAIVLAFPLAS